MKIWKKAVSVLLAAVMAVTMLFAGSVTAGARTVEKKSDGSVSVTYDSDDWYVVYYPSTAWVTVKDGAMIASLSRRILEIHMPNVYFDSYNRATDGYYLEFYAGNSDNSFFCRLCEEEKFYEANFYCSGERCEPSCFETCRTTKEDIDEYYSERVVKLLLNLDCPDTVIQCLESGFKTGDFRLTVGYYKDFGESVTYFLNEEEVSYSVHENGTSKSVSSLSATVKNQTYTGKARTPDVTIKDGSKTLKKGTDYTLTYKNNKKIGTASVTIKGKGDYSGEKTLTFQIVPKKTTLTAKKSGEKITLKWDTVKGAGKYQIYYREKGSSKYKKLTTVSGSKTSCSTSKLDKNKTYQFKIRSYAESGGKKYYSSYSKVVTTK